MTSILATERIPHAEAGTWLVRLLMLFTVCTVAPPLGPMALSLRLVPSGLDVSRLRGNVRIAGEVDSIALDRSVLSPFGRLRRLRLRMRGGEYLELEVWSGQGKAFVEHVLRAMPAHPRTLRSNAHDGVAVRPLAEALCGSFAALSFGVATPVLAFDGRFAAIGILVAAVWGAKHALRTRIKSFTMSWSSEAQAFVDESGAPVDEHALGPGVREVMGIARNVYRGT